LLLRDYTDYNRIYAFKCSAPAKKNILNILSKTKHTIYYLQNITNGVDGFPVIFLSIKFLHNVFRALKGKFQSLNYLNLLKPSRPCKKAQRQPNMIWRCGK